MDKYEDYQARIQDKIFKHKNNRLNLQAITLEEADIRVKIEYLE